jgi:hypothetical protein
MSIHKHEDKDSDNSDTDNEICHSPSTPMSYTMKQISVVGAENELVSERRPGQIDLEDSNLVDENEIRIYESEDELVIDNRGLCIYGGKNEEALESCEQSPGKNETEILIKF